MPVATVRVPAGQVEALRSALIHLYSVEAESIHQAVTGCLSDGEPLESPLAHREELLELDRLLAQAGWGSLSAPADDVELSGDQRLLSCALHGVLIDLAEEVAEGYAECWRGERKIDELCQPARGVLQLLSLLASLDRPARQAHGPAGERSPSPSGSQARFHCIPRVAKSSKAPVAKLTRSAWQAEIVNSPADADGPASTNVEIASTATVAMDWARRITARTPMTRRRPRPAQAWPLPSMAMLMASTRGSTARSSARAAAAARARPARLAALSAPGS